ncbi:MAG: response regulator [Chthonomonadales bacterium]|nr:response regulator [Chthonomonadales bacterium]
MTPMTAGPGSLLLPLQRSLSGFASGHAPPWSCATDAESGFAAGQATPLPDSGGRPGTARPPTVLVVDDEALVRGVSTQVLRTAGMTVLEAGSGDEAIRISESHDGAIDVLVSDVVMPSIDGRALATRLSRARPELRVLLVSGYSESPIGAIEPRPRALAFLRKPFRPMALLAEVRALLAAP